MESARLPNPHPSTYLCFLLLTLFGVPADTATSYSSYSSFCHFPVPALDLPADHHSRGARTILPHISTGHFSGGGNLHFAPDRSYCIRSFSFFPRSHVRTTDPTVIHIFATLILEGSGLGGSRKNHMHSVAFELEGYYSAAGASAELCMVGSGSYARDNGVGAKVLLSDVALRLHVPRPSNLSQPFVTGRLEGADFGAVTLVAYADSSDQDDGYAYAHAAYSCPAPPAPVRDGRHVLNAGFSCSRLRSLLRGSYSLDYDRHAASSSLPRLRHRRMHVNQMSCATDGSVRAYIAFYADRSGSFPSNHFVEWRDSSLFLVGDEALVADGFWDSSRSQLCLTACRVVRSDPSRADLAVRECGVGVSFWFPAVWSFWDRRTASGLIWNATSRTSDDGDTDKTSSGVMISVSRTVGYTYTGDLSDIKYSYTRVEEATKYYLSKMMSSMERKAAGRFPGSSCVDFAFQFSLKKLVGLSGSASPVAIGSTLLEGDRLMTDDAFSRQAAEEVNNQSLLNVSYYLQYQVSGVDSYATEMMPQERRIMAEGVYDTKTGYMCMVACQDINGSSDCELMVTVQFAPMDGKARARAVGTISSLRKQSDLLFFEALDFVADGMYPVQIAELRWRMDVEGFMTVVTTALSSVLIALQLRHGKKHREALPATSVTMLVVLTLGYLIPLTLDFENTVITRHDFFFQLELSKTGGFARRASTLLAFVLQLRLLQVTLSERRQTGAGRDDGGASSIAAAAAAEKNTLRACLPLYLVGAVVMLFVNRSVGRVRLLINATEQTLVELLSSYGGLILDAFLLPQVISNAYSGANARALSPWFYVGGTVNRAAPHLYNVFCPPLDGLFGVAWDSAVLCGAALLAALLFLQQRLGGAFLCCLMKRRPGKDWTVPTLNS